MPSRPRPFAAFHKPAEIPQPTLFKRPDLFKLRARIKPKPKPTLGEQIGKDVSQIADDVANTVREAQGHVTGVEKDTIVLLLTTALVTPLMGYVGLSPVLGYLFAGMVLGPGCLGLVSDVATTTKLAELGVVFFLFEMGLELEYERLKSVGRDAFRLGSLQFALTSSLIAAIGSTLFKISPAAAVVIGGGLALSSSAFAIQLLSEKGELASRFGRASFGILLFQDIAVVPLLVVTPLLGGSGAQLGAALRLAAFKSVSALGVIIVTGRLLLQRVFQVVASAKDQTAFLAITLLTVLSMSAFTQARTPPHTATTFHVSSRRPRRPELRRSVCRTPSAPSSPACSSPRRAIATRSRRTSRRSAGCSSASSSSLPASRLTSPSRSRRRPPSSRSRSDSTRSRRR